MSLDSTEKDIIRQIVQPWRFREDQPPFSHEQMIAMALALHENPMTESEILKWIALNFRFYGFAVISGLADASGFHSSRQIQSLLPDYYQCHPFSQYDLPVVEIRDFGPRGDTATYRLSTSGARIVLKDMLPWKPQGTLPFLDLEPELRMMIYEMVLGFPKSGLRFQGQTWDLSGLLNPKLYSLSVQSKDFKEEMCLEPDTIGVERYKLLPPNKVLALLLVNRQIYQETLPLFYRLNTFVMTGALLHHDFQRLLAPSRHQFLRHLAIIHDDDRESSGFEFDWLPTLQGLRKITIWMDDEEWFDDSWDDDDETVLNIPGLSVLSKLRQDVEAHFVGPCPKISAYWDAELNQSTSSS